MDDRRSKRVVLALVLLSSTRSLFFFGFLLACGLHYAAACEAASTLAPWLLLGVYLWVTRHFSVRFGRLAALQGTAFPALVTLLRGGLRNSGFHAAGLCSGVVCLVLSRDFRACGAAATLSVAILVGLAASDAVVFHHVVDVWHAAPALSDTAVLVGAVLNATTVVMFSIGMLGFTLVDSAPQLQAYEEMERRMDDLISRLLRMDLEGMPCPPHTAVPLERHLFEVVQSFRRWKPYIPASLFLESGGAATAEERSVGEGSLSLVYLRPVNSLIEETMPTSVPSVGADLGVTSPRNSPVLSLLSRPRPRRTLVERRDTCGAPCPAPSRQCLQRCQKICEQRFGVLPRPSGGLFGVFRGGLPSWDHVQVTLQARHGGHSPSARNCAPRCVVSFQKQHYTYYCICDLLVLSATHRDRPPIINP